MLFSILKLCYSFQGLLFASSVKVCCKQVFLLKRMSVDISQDFLFLWLIKKQSGLRSISSPDVRGSSLWGSEPKGKFCDLT